MNPPSVIAEFQHVSHSFGPQPILRDISFTITQGETVCIIGESGCGKTVSLKLLVGLMQPTIGKIKLFDFEVHATHSNQLRILRQRIGFLFQGSALFDSLRVKENVAYPMVIRGQLSPEQIDQEVIARLEEVGLSKTVADRYPSELSGGMQKRVALARSLASNPDLICYDEPTTGLDPVMTEVINELILQTKLRRPLTSLVVTHELRTIRRVADRVIMLYPLSRLATHEPQIIYDGPTSGLFESSDPRIQRFLA